MASRYSVIQYVPNPIAGERINVGVVVYSADSVRVRFVNNWERVRHFGMENIEFLKNFACQMEDEAEVGLLFPEDQSEMANHEKILRIAKGWINSIQFTEPRGSLSNVDELLDDVTSTYLREQDLELIPKVKVRDRQAAAKIIRRKTREVLMQKFGERTGEFLKKDYGVKGISTNNKFDVVVANGRPYFAAHGISFEVDIPDTLKDAVSWKISDVKKHLPSFPLAILMLPPKSEQNNYNQIEKRYKQTMEAYKILGAEIIQEDSVERWVLEQINNLDIQ